MQNEVVVKNEIIDAAGKLFQQFGLHKTTMEDIARQTGKSKSTLYYFFKNKNEVFDAVVTREIDEVALAVQKRVAEAKTPQEKIMAYALCNFRELKCKVILYKLVCGEIKGNLNRLMLSLRAKFDIQEVEFLSTILTEGIQQGILKSIEMEDVPVLSHTIVSALRGIEVDLFIENKLPGFEDRIDKITGMLIRGLL